MKSNSFVKRYINKVLPDDIYTDTYIEKTMKSVQIPSKRVKLACDLSCDQKLRLDFIAPPTNVNMETSLNKVIKLAND